MSLICVSFSFAYFFLFNDFCIYLIIYFDKLGIVCSALLLICNHEFQKHSLVNPEREASDLALICAKAYFGAGRWKFW